jgi:hypothetical protein
MAGTEIRGMHQYVFRSGEWAVVEGVVMLPGSGAYPRANFSVRFPDGQRDCWPIYDEHAHYEFREAE